MTLEMLSKHFHQTKQPNHAALIIEGFQLWEELRQNFVAALISPIPSPCSVQNKMHNSNSSKISSSKLLSFEFLTLKGFNIWLKLGLWWAFVDLQHRSSDLDLRNDRTRSLPKAASPGCNDFLTSHWQTSDIYTLLRNCLIWSNMFCLCLHPQVWYISHGS